MIHTLLYKTIYFNKTFTEIKSKANKMFKSHKTVCKYQELDDKMKFFSYHHILKKLSKKQVTKFKTKNLRIYGGKLYMKIKTILLYATVSIATVGRS